MNFPLFTIFYIIIYFRSVYSFVDLSYFKTFVSNLVDDKNSGCLPPKSPKEVCDENQVMLQLAKMYIISPERVLLLLTADSMGEACTGVADTMNKINKTQTGCIPLNSDNLYMKLLKTYMRIGNINISILEMFTLEIKKIGDCLPELREEFLDCEGAPDWYENTNQTVRCQVFNDIVNCNYVKSAMLCGLEPAATIRGFSAELFQQALPLKSSCKLSRTLPSVQDPMPASSPQRYIHSILHLTSFIVLIKTIS